MTIDFRQKLMQSIFSLPQSTKKTSSINQIKPPNHKKSKKASPHEALSQLFFNLLYSKQYYVDTTTFRESLPEAFRATHEEQDASEFIKIYLDYLEKSLSDNTQAKDLINECFQGENLEMIECCECQRVIKRKSGFLDLILNFSNTNGNHRQKQHQEDQQSQSHQQQQSPSHSQSQPLSQSQQQQQSPSRPQSQQQQQSPSRPQPQQQPQSPSRLQPPSQPQYQQSPSRPRPQPPSQSQSQPQLDLFPKAKTYDLLEMIKQAYSEEEFLGDNRFYCDFCKKLSALTIKKTQIMGLPQDLIITLNRFYYEKSMRTRFKICDYVKLYSQFDFKGIFDHLKSAKATAYSLYAIIVHSGSSPETGHYYTFARELDNPNTWLLFNDRSVYAFYDFNIQTFLQQNPTETPYMVFYKRQEQKDIRSP